MSKAKLQGHCLVAKFLHAASMAGSKRGQRPAGQRET